MQKRPAPSLRACQHQYAVANRGDRTSKLPEVCDLGLQDLVELALVVLRLLLDLVLELLQVVFRECLVLLRRLGVFVPVVGRCDRCMAAIFADEPFEDVDDTTVRCFDC